jgi:protein-L-isoaspartate(D-aspartate) O-methyltransferase
LATSFFGSEAVRRPGGKSLGIEEQKMVDSAQQRLNMVESQVRPSDVTDRRIIRAMLNVAREEFVPDTFASLAYSDVALTLQAEPGTPPRKMLSPRVLAKLLQAADLKAHDVVLDVGCATGYTPALLSGIVETVVALDEENKFVAAATETLAARSADNVAVVQGPLINGYPDAGPFDVIIVEGAVADQPTHLIKQLKDGGRLVAILRTGPGGKVCRWQAAGDHIAETVLFDATADLLPGFETQPVFTL